MGKMLKLYKFDFQKSKWVFVDYGVLSQEELYTKMGYVVVYPETAGL